MRIPLTGARRRRRGRKKPVGPPITEAAQASMFARRAVLIGSAQAGLAAILAARMGYIAIAENEKYALLAEENRIHERLIPPRRGGINRSWIRFSSASSAYFSFSAIAI